MRVYYIAFLLLCGLLLVSTAEAANKALIIGVGKYADSRANLPGIDNDIAAMQDAAKKLGFTDIKVLKDQDATKRSIEDAITNWLAKGVGPTDTVMLYFSGHGTQKKDLSGDEEDNWDEALCPHDIAVGNGDILNVLVDDEINTLITAIPSKVTYILVDACHSGTSAKNLGSSSVSKFFWYKGVDEAKCSRSMSRTPKSSQDRERNTNNEPNTNYIVLSAALDSEEAQATPSGSLFTNGIAHAIEQAARQGTPINMRELNVAAKQYIDRYAQSDRKQTPMLSGGTTQFADANMFLPQAANEGSQNAGKNWRDIENIVAKAEDHLQIQINKENLKLGEVIEVTCRIPKDGYLNILNISREKDEITVLFPNALHTDNMVHSGQVVKIPGPDYGFEWYAGEEGKVMMAAFLTDKPVNFYKKGSLGSDGVFAELKDTIHVRGAFHIRKRENEKNAFVAGIKIATIQ